MIWVVRWLLITALTAAAIALLAVCVWGGLDCHTWCHFGEWGWA